MRAFWIGIAVAGGNENVIRQNRVTGSQRYGIAVFPTARFVVFDPSVPEPGHPGARGNRVSRNVVTGSGWADLALAKAQGRAIASPPTSLGVRCRGGLQTHL